MKFWLLVSWRHQWDEQGMEVRAFDNEKDAKSTALQYNAVLIEVFQREGDLQPHVDAHDYEFRDKDGEPAPVLWVDIPKVVTQGGRWTWATAAPPVVRVGKDIERSEYEGMVKNESN